MYLLFYFYIFYTLTHCGQSFLIVPLPFGPFVCSGCRCCRAGITFLFAFCPDVAAAAAADGRSVVSIFILVFLFFFLNANLWACVAIWLPLGNFSAHQNTEQHTKHQTHRGSTTSKLEPKPKQKQKPNRNRKCSKRNKK